MQIKITKTTNPKARPQGKLGFGKYFTDHMFTLQYSGGQWHNPEIRPYEAFKLDPASQVLHYAQGIFEGAKAYKNNKGEITVFRLTDNINRMADSADRVCIPAFDKDFVYDAIKQLILVDADWIPVEDGTSLYIRPTIIATEAALGVKASAEYILYVILSPVGAYYANGLQPVKLLVEEDYVRSCKGGTGGHKVIANYAISLKAGEKAKKLGFDQAMWLDAVHHRYVEEVGAMNIFFVLKDKVLTPSLEKGSILPGITRRSIIQMIKEKGIAVEETDIDIVQMSEFAQSGQLTEVFGTGTAAVISPVGCFNYQGKDYLINGGKMGELSTYLYDTLTGIQCGKIADTHGWVKKIN